MFPGIDGFHWTFGHVLFLSLFFAVALTIFTTIASAVVRTIRDFRDHRAIDFCWKADFVELPPSDRRCRHELAGRVSSRTCDQRFRLQKLRQLFKVRIVCRRKEFNWPRHSTTRQTVTITADTHG